MRRPTPHRCTINDAHVEQPYLGPTFEAEVPAKEHACASTAKRKRRRFGSDQERAAAQRERQVRYNAQRRAERKKKKEKEAEKKKGKDAADKQPSVQVCSSSYVQL